ncbi:MAG: hypothetical protein SO013_10495 [Prevotella sp.]|nr:hypothetical protein [Prevotella sp.]
MIQKADAAMWRGIYSDYLYPISKNATKTRRRNDLIAMIDWLYPHCVCCC